MGKKDAKGKKGAAERKARTAAKADKKAGKKTTKKAAAAGDEVEDDVDIDAVLAEYARQQTLFNKVTETLLPAPPAARANATLTASPTNAHELLLFGGELFNGALATFFNDLYVYNILRDEWKHVTSPNSPLPRSGHFVCTSGGRSGVGSGKGAAWLFGGEFSSPKQGTFYHYGDFWRLDCDKTGGGAMEWEKIEGKGKAVAPHARSGHRMVAWRHFIVLFGGFQDTSSSTKYLNDLWLFDTQTYTWIPVVLPAHAQRPDARSSFSFLPHEAGAVLFGGYSRAKTASASGAGGKGQKQQQLTSKHAMATKPVVHTDTWLLRINLENPGTATRWERRKKPANAPNPPRVGVTMAHHKGRGIMFGGVHDTEHDEEGLDSIFFNDLYAWGTDRNRFFELVLRKPRGNRPGGANTFGGGGGGGGSGEGRGGGGGGGGRRDRAKEDADELLANLARLEALALKNSGVQADTPIPGEEDASEAASAAAELALQEKQEQQPISLTLPQPRFNSALAVQNDTLYIYGGTWEKGDREFTFDEMYAVDLVRLDGVRTIFSRKDELEWIDVDEEDDDEEEDDEDEDDEDEDDDDDEANQDPETIAKNREILRMQEEGKERKRLLLQQQQQALEDAAASADAEAEAEDQTPFPRPFESLKEFHARTSEAWQDIVLALSGGDIDRGGQGRTVKEMRKEAFAAAEERWWAVREEVRALEDEQEEAGIAEVVSLKDKAASGAGGAGGSGRRR
ncbi:hypothetical protein DFH27DRAFT_574544 [Peziza echinospora]|nr:hypothetical protein DFH27DRAFT_574544 [Peziza echinospora]